MDCYQDHQDDHQVGLSLFLINKIIKNRYRLFFFNKRKNWETSARIDQFYRTVSPILICSSILIGVRNIQSQSTLIDCISFHFDINIDCIHFERTRNLQSVFISALQVNMVISMSIQVNLSSQFIVAREISTN